MTSPVEVSPSYKKTIRDTLQKEGWRTPNTYGNAFGELPKSSGIYLFLRTEFYKFVDVVLYVGMSTNIAERVSGHEIKPLFPEDDHWAFTYPWFKPLPVAVIRAQERLHIERFNPSYNIIGRKRGL